MACRSTRPVNGRNLNNRWISAAWRPPRKAYMLVEISIAAAILVVLLTVLSPLLTALARQRQQHHQHAMALQAADNLLEALAMQPWNEVQPHTNQQIELPALLRGHFPEGAAFSSVEQQQDPPHSRRIVVEVKSSTRARPVVLTTWVHAPEKGLQ